MPTETGTPTDGKTIWSRRTPPVTAHVEPVPLQLPLLQPKPALPPLKIRLETENVQQIEPPAARTPEEKQTEPVIFSPPVRKEPISPDQSLEEIAAIWPEEISKAVRTLLLRENETENSAAATRQVAIALIALGPDLTTGILKHLSDDEIKIIARAIAEIDIVSPEQQEVALDEIKQILIKGKYIARGGVDIVRNILQTALGPRKARTLLDHIPGASESGFYLLRSVDPAQIVPFISKEHPQTIAVIVSQLDAAQAAGVLNGLPKEIQADVSLRIATLENISPQALSRLEESLARDLQALLARQITEIGGPKAIAEILNHTGRSTEKAILVSLDITDPELAEEVRNQMFVFDDIAKLTDREIQIILREVDGKDLAVALKGADEKLKERFLSNLGEETKKKVEEEMKYSGPIRMSDVEEVQLRIVQTIRQLEEAGKVTIVRGDTEDTFI